jgi:hypothetical protein
MQPMISWAVLADICCCKALAGTLLCLLMLTHVPLMPRSWSKFSAGFTIGGLSGVGWAYVCTQILPYYQ